MRVIEKIYKIMRLLWSVDKRPTMLCMLCLLLENAERILRILLPAFVIQSLTEWAGDDVWLQTFIAIACIAVFGLLARVGRGLMTPYGTRASGLVRAKLREKLMKLSLEYSESKELLDKYKLVDSTFYKFMDTDYYVICDLLGAVVTLIVMSFILCRVNVFVYLTVLLISVLVYRLGKKESAQLYAYENEKKELYSKKKIYLDMLYDTEKMKEMKLFRVGEMISGEYRDVTEALVEKNIAMEKYSFGMSMKREVISLIQMAAIYLNAIREYKLGRVGAGTVYVIVSAGAEIVSSVINIVNSVNEIREVTLYYDDFEAYLMEKESMYEHEGETEHIGQIERIEFKNVSFRYKAMEQDSLQNVSCVLKKGEKIALLGENGAGKTTFVKLLLRLYDPTEGEILANGKNIKCYAYDEYLQAISAVFQDVELTAYTILENIVLDREIQPERLKAACRISGIDKRIEALKDGIHTIVSKDLSEEGVDFSGGECQKIAIARALYKGTQTLLLDEPTSAMDVFAERELFEDIHSTYPDSLVVYITHRISNVAFCNRIILFKNGVLEMTGTHEEMMRKSDEYKEMFDKQASYYS